jgi:tRNA/rRNA methyltransferase
MVFCYELFQSSTTNQKETAPLASSDHLERMFEHMERTLLAIEFLDAKQPERIMRVLRKIFGRSQMDEREVQVLQGIWSKVDWFLGKKIKNNVLKIDRLVKSRHSRENGNPEDF